MSRIADVLQKKRQQAGERNEKSGVSGAEDVPLPPTMESVAVPWQLEAPPVAARAPGIVKARAVPEEVVAQVRHLFRTTGPDGSVVHRVLFSGADRSERAGEVARQVAEALIHLAMGSVCLADLDVRDVTMTRRLHLEGRPGFSDAVLGAEAPRACVHDQPRIPGVSLMPAGTRTGDFVAMLESGEPLDSVARALSGFNYVVGVAAPVGDHRDAVVLSAAFDGVVLVAEAGVTDPEAMRGAARTLQSAKVRLLGTFIANR